MDIFSSVGRLHLESHKDLEQAKKLTVLDETKVTKVYLPAVAPNGTDANVLVKAGDHVLVGTRVIERKDFYVPIYSPVSGVVVGIESINHPNIGHPVKHLVIASDGKGEKLPNALKTIDPAKATKDELCLAIKEAGITGLGGAGFPTFIKYTGVKNIDYILLNGAECEPYLTTDYLAMQLYTSEMLQGAELLRLASGAKEVVIAFKVHKEAVKEALDEHIGRFPLIRYVEVPDVYPMGWEKFLIKQIFNRTYDKLPSQAAIIVNNVQTAIAVKRALIDGDVISHRLVSVNGDGVMHPGNILVPIGTPASLIIEALGGYSTEEVYLLPGGPMTAKAAEDDTFPIQAPMGGLTVLKGRFYPDEPCLRCGACTAVCPAFIQPVEIQIALEHKDEERMTQLNVSKCVECGLCAFVCPSKIEVSENMKRAKRYLKFVATRNAVKK
ncbi:MAG: RnfABCDGE type electron transport complex subunit C [Firmicutes bacterium]|nr:RnfABCDGE type electron transport complex subunit C [Bacillota bacterium]